MNFSNRTQLGPPGASYPRHDLFIATVYLEINQLMDRGYKRRRFEKVIIAFRWEFHYDFECVANARLCRGRHQRVKQLELFNSVIGSKLRVIHSRDYSIFPEFSCGRSYIPGPLSSP